MWWKLLLLTVYLVVLFLLSRVLEAVAYYEAGYIASRLLDPVSLSVRKLKTLLDQRGVSYAGVVEKQELTELVNTSGEVSEGELDVATLAEETVSITNFTCGSHFYEEVEDTKDSVWVVQVMRDKISIFLRSDEWHAFMRKVSRFGVRTGVFDCTLDPRLCDRKNWHTSRLVMALPQGHRAKDNVILRSYTASTKVQAVFDWVNYNLASRVREIYDYEELRQDWLQWHSDTREDISVRLVLFSKMKIPPMFYSVLSVKFAGRAKFATVNINTAEGAKIVKRLGLQKLPTYMVLTPEANMTFGERCGEYLNYPSMALLLRTLHPEVNDIFLLSLVLINIACWFELCITHGNLFKRLGNMLWSVVKWNCFLILLWLPVLGLFQLPYVDSLLNHTLKILRMIGTTPFAAHIRCDWLWYSSMHLGLLLCTFVLFALVIGFLHHWYMEEVPTTTLTNNNSNWVNFNLYNYTNYLFRPVATLTRPMNPPDMDLEVGMELLIERLAVPNFWLRPMINSDYIKDLPTWRFTGHNTDSDVCSDVDSTKSDGEDIVPFEGGPSRCHSADSLRSLPYMFTCEKCRDLQKQIEDGHKSEEEIEEERRENESACAKYLMDGDYRCLCKNSCGSSGTQRSSRHLSRASSKTRARSLSPLSPSSEIERSRRDRQEDESANLMPPGMLLVSECAICLESYKYGYLLCGLPCGHSFHQQCILGWLSRDNHCCPVCRWPTYKAKPCSMHSHAE